MQNPALRRLLAAAWASNAGDGIRVAALPLLAAAITRDPGSVAGITFFQSLPWLLFGLVAGSIVDRRPRVQLMIAGNLLRALVVLTIGIVAAQDDPRLPVLFALAFAFGLGETITDSAAQAVLPDLVRDDELERANGSLLTAEMVGNDLVGPPIGAALFSVSKAMPFVADAVSFVAASILVRPLQVPDGHVEEAKGRSLWADLKIGAGLLWRNRLLRVTSIAVLLLQVAHIGARATLVLYATGDVGLSPQGFGVLLAFSSVGGVLGSWLAPRLIERLGTARTWPLALAVAAAGHLLMTVRHPALVALGDALAFAGLLVGRVIILSARQRGLPSGELGRAGGAVRTLVWGSAATGAALGGALAQIGDLRTPIYVAAATYALVAVGSARPLARALAPDTVVDVTADGSGVQQPLPDPRRDAVP
jgi:Na+/melibiose symporter-like transporter